MRPVILRHDAFVGRKQRSSVAPRPLKALIHARAEQQRKAPAPVAPPPPRLEPARIRQHDTYKKGLGHQSILDEDTLCAKTPPKRKENKTIQVKMSTADGEYYERPLFRIANESDSENESANHGAASLTSGGAVNNNKAIQTSYTEGMTSFTQQSPPFTLCRKKVRRVLTRKKSKSNSARFNSTTRSFISYMTDPDSLGFVLNPNAASDHVRSSWPIRGDALNNAFKSKLSDSVNNKAVPQEHQRTVTTFKAESHRNCTEALQRPLSSPPMTKPSSYESCGTLLSPGRLSNGSGTSLVCSDIDLTSPSYFRAVDPASDTSDWEDKTVLSF